MIYIGLQATVSKSFPDGLSSDIGEAEPLEVSNTMCLRTSKCSDSNTSVMGGEFTRMTRFGLHIIEVFGLCIPVMDAVDCGSVKVKLCPNLLV